MSTDDRVRDALAELAPVAPADGAAFAGVRRAVTRRRRRRAAGRIAAVVVALGAVAGGALAIDRADTSTPPAGEGMRDPSRVSFGALSLELPDGWDVVTVDENPGQYQFMCIAPAESTEPLYGDCALTIYQGERLPGNEMNEYRDHAPWGWYQGTDTDPCPMPSEHGPNDGIGQTDAGYEPVDTGERSIGGRTAVYDRWAARCQLSGFEFSPRAWHVAEEQLLILEYIEQPETEAILDSIRWADGG